MNTSDPAGAADPLNLYDLTHGQRRLTVWRDHGRDGCLTTHAMMAVPVTMQAPGEPPETEWTAVVTARSVSPRLVQDRVDACSYRLILDGAEFALLLTETEMLAEHLGLVEVQS